jgi:hypothetical protein
MAAHNNVFQHVYACSVVRPLMKSLMKLGHGGCIDSHTVPPWQSLAGSNLVRCARTQQYVLRGRRTCSATMERIWAASSPCNTVQSQSYNLTRLTALYRGMKAPEINHSRYRRLHLEHNEFVHSVHELRAEVLLHLQSCLSMQCQPGWNLPGSLALLDAQVTCSIMCCCSYRHHICSQRHATGDRQGTASGWLRLRTQVTV